MSLINKMLQDLEARQETSTAAGAPVYEGLRPVGTDARHGSGRLLTVLLAVLAVSVAAYFAVERLGVALLPASVMAMISPKAPVPTNVAPTASAPTPMAAAPPSTPVAPAPDSAPTAHKETRSPAANEVEPAASPAANKTAVAVEPKPAQPPPAARPHDTESQKNSQVRIVKAAKPPTAAVSNVERAKPPTKTPSAIRKAEAAVALPAQQVAVVDKKIRPLTAEEKSEAAYRRAVRFLDQGRPEDAIAQLRELLREQPSHAKARELAAGLALQGGHWREAQELLEEGLRQVPSHYPFARLLARVYVDHGSEAKALTVMESAVPAGSDDPDFSALLGVLYQRAGRHADAVQVYKRALTLRPQDARTWLGFAISLEGTEQWDSAKRAYARAKDSGGLTPPLAQYAEQRLAALNNK